MRTILTAIILLIFAASSAIAQPQPHPVNAQIQTVVEQISSDSLLSYITRLTEFHTRHTFSDTTSDSVGIGAAMRWVQSKGQGYDPGNHISWEWFPWSGYFGANLVTRHILIARAPGVLADSTRYIVGGHLDSRTVSINDNTGLAPGADDNGSSCAALLEMVRLLPDSLAHNLELIWFTGEEQGLWGSAAYAESLAQRNARVDGMFGMDMIGHIQSSTGGIDTVSLRLYAAADVDHGTASPARNLQRYYRWVGQAYAAQDSFLIVIFPLTDRPGRGGDHISFSDQGYPSVRVMERNENTAFQHNPNDQPQYLSSIYARKIAMCTLGTLLTMLNAPERPSPLIAERVDVNRVHVTIPDSIDLPAGGRFYVTSRDYYHDYFDEIVDIGTARDYEFTVIVGSLYGFSVSRADSNDLPSPFSTEVVLDLISSAHTPAPLPNVTVVSVTPNPFNSEVVFQLDLSRSGHVSLVIYDLLGREAATLLDGNREAGEYRVPWAPQGLASGIYFAKLSTTERTLLTKIVYLR